MPPQQEADTFSSAPGMQRRSRPQPLLYRWQFLLYRHIVISTSRRIELIQQHPVQPPKNGGDSCEGFSGSNLADMHHPCNEMLCCPGALPAGVVVDSQQTTGSTAAPRRI
jgi:hypothetical protein